MKENNTYTFVSTPFLRAANKERTERNAHQNTGARLCAQRYVKPGCLRVFENEYNAAYYTGRMANIPIECRALYKFSDKSANELTRAIVAWLNSHGAFGARVNTTGTFDKRTGRYRCSGSTKGMADVTAIIGGKHVSLEIKHGHDKPRAAQLQVQQQVQQAGGIYEFVHTFAEFLQLMHRHGLIDTELFNTYGVNE